MLKGVTIPFISEERHFPESVQETFVYILWVTWLLTAQGKLRK